MRTRFCVVVLAMVLSGCGWDVPGSIDKDEARASPADCVEGTLCVGAARRAIAPTQEQVDGVMEDRLPGTQVLQKFHLGGFGFGPFESAKFLASFSNGMLDERLCFGETCLSEPAASRPHHCRLGAVGCEDEEADRTWVRAFYVAQPGGEAVVFVALDAVGAGNIIIDAIKAAVGEVTGIGADSVIVGMTHSHAGADLQGLWGGVPQAWVYETLVAGAAAAAAEAKENAEAATLVHAHVREAALNNYRRPRYYRENDADTILSVLQARAHDGKTLGTMVQYAAHPTAIGSDSGGELGRAVHADYILGLADEVEASTGAPAIYFNGPIADASGSGPTEGEDDYERVRYRGTCLARSALSMLDAKVERCAFSEVAPDQIAVTTLAPQLEVAHASALLPVTNPLFLVIGLTGTFNRYYTFTPLPIDAIPLLGPQRDNLPQLTPTASTIVSRVTIGGAETGLEIVTIPGEATNTFGEYIRGLTANPNMMLLGLTQNSYGYIIPEEEFNYIDLSSDAGFVLPFTGYEEFVSLGPLTAPLLRLQAYNPLFGIPQADPRNLPPSVTACIDDPAGRACLVSHLISRVDYVQRAYANLCRENLPQAEALCAALDPQTPIYEPCVAAGLPQALCDVVGSAEGVVPPE